MVLPAELLQTLALCLRKRTPLWSKSVSSWLASCSAKAPIYQTGFSFRRNGHDAPFDQQTTRGKVHRPSSAALLAKASRRLLMVLSHCGSEGAFEKKTLHGAEGITDSSFAPPGERTHQYSMTFLGGSLLTWTSQRQAFMTESTAECELVGLAHVLSDLEAQSSLSESLLEDKAQCVLYYDNKATISICTTPFGSWKSRYLHVRPNVIKQKLRQWWSRHLHVRPNVVKEKCRQR